MTEVDFIPKQFVVVSETEPSPFEGLIWYNPATKLWKMYSGGEWKILIPFYTGDTEPAEATDGMLWYDSLNDVMNVYDEAAATWNRLGIDWADIVNRPSVFPPDYTNYPPDWSIISNIPSPTPIDQTANRALNTVYQNTSGKHLLVITTISFNVESSSDYAQAIGYISSDNVTYVEMSFARFADIDYNSYIWTGGGTIVMVVPPNYYYKVAAGASYGSSVSLRKWWEVELWK
ncbi:hypothetical protein [Archaeoglobus veneficus]|uniref:Uncharacterized protein n=1 Tax=Archaeoglobus veneficus (strain DSM 11195 / SNP6) TaxID=693661 RepID=F2KSJ4_ARCVS|nr:hypothetical protein [Archaeoglobus veneficus]AEA48064.1 hypothetical protein Arcve_2074 [Archaeoglobus veneficus SNP6]